MTEPTSSAAPVTSVIRATSRQRLLLRLRRLVVNASWLPFVLLVFVILLLDDHHDSFAAFLVSLSLMLVWPLVVINNVARGRPPRWGPLVHAGVGLLNLTLAFLFAVAAVSVADDLQRDATAILIIGGATSSFVLGVVVLVRKRHRFSVRFVAALVSTVAALFLTFVVMSMTEARMWRRWMPYVAEAPPHLEPAVTLAPPAPTPPPVIVAPTPAPVVEPPAPSAPSHPAALSPFPHGAESDCAVEVVDKARRVWLVGGREPPCDWLVNLDDTAICGDEDDAGAVHVEGHPELRISLARQGQRVESHADDIDHSRQGAQLRIGDAAAVRVIVHGFCRASEEEEDDEPYVAPVIPGHPR